MHGGSRIASAELAFAVDGAILIPRFFFAGDFSLTTEPLAVTRGLVLTMSFCSEIGKHVSGVTLTLRIPSAAQGATETEGSNEFEEARVEFMCRLGDRDCEDERVRQSVRACASPIPVSVVVVLGPLVAF